MPAPIGYGFPTGQGFLSRLATAYASTSTFQANATFSPIVTVKAGDILFANYTWSAITPGASPGFVDLVTFTGSGSAVLEIRETSSTATVQIAGDAVIGTSIPIGGTECLMFRVKTGGTILTFGTSGAPTEYGTAPTSKAANIMVDVWGYVA